LPRGRPPESGHIRKVCYFCPAAHPIFVSHYLPATAFDRLTLPSGGTLLLASPGNSRWRNLFGSGDAIDVFGDAGSAEEGYKIKCLKLVTPLWSKRIQVLRIEPMTEIRAAITKAIEEL
jgi:hypothetical protein